MSALSKPAVTNAVETQIDAVLAWHDDNARAAIATLLEDCCHLRQQLALTEGIMSSGFARGWRPAYDRNSAAS